MTTPNDTAKPPGPPVTAGAILAAFERRYRGKLQYDPKRRLWFQRSEAGEWVPDPSVPYKILKLVATIGRGLDRRNRMKVDSYSMVMGTERLARSSPVFCTPGASRRNAA
jgi:hypothetical protein